MEGREFSLFLSDGNAIIEGMNAVTYIKYLLRNRISYYSYKLKTNFNIMGAVSLLSFVLAMVGFFSDLLVVRNGSIVVAVIALLPVILDLIKYLNNYAEKFTSIRRKKDYYDDVEFPGWEKITILNGSEKSQVFVRKQANEFLRSDRPIKYIEKNDYSKLLKKKIQKNWETYRHFLKRKYLDANYFGKLFFNESKYGMSREFDENSSTVVLHKTCYFDSFLTNICPGSEVIFNKDNETVAKLDGELSCITNNGQLKTVTDYLCANEPGGSTLLFDNHSIRLYEQSLLAQSSVSRIVPTGSGSVDYSDIRQSGRNGDFRDLITYSINRELFEEAFNGRKCNYSDYVDTRVIGYYKWAEKAGKAEFIGISRMHDDNVLLQEKSKVELTGDEHYIKANTVEILMESIKRELPDIENDVINAGNYSIPCVIAMRYLYEMCKEVDDKQIAPETALFR